MQLYSFDRTTGYEALECVDKDVWFDLLLALDGVPRAATWKPFQVRRIGKARKRSFRASGSPYEADYVLFFRRSAVDALRDILEAHGELLPVEDEGGVELYLYHPHALDALDQIHTPGMRDEEEQRAKSSLDAYGNVGQARAFLLQWLRKESTRRCGGACDERTCVIGPGIFGTRLEWFC